MSYIINQLYSHNRVIIFNLAAGRRARLQNNQQYMHCLIVLWMMCLRMGLSQPTASLSVTLSNSVIQEVSTYTFKITIHGDGISNTTVPSGSGIIIKFPSLYPSAPPISNNCTTVGLWPALGGPIQCTLAYNVLTINNMVAAGSQYLIDPSTNDQFTFVVQSITNPTYAQQINNPPISGSINFANQDLLAFSSNSLVVIQSGVLGVGISASPTTTESLSTLTLSITPTHSIPVGGCLKITLDKNYTTSNFAPALISQTPLCQSVANASANIYCTYTTNINNIIVTVANIFIVPSNSPFVFTLYPFNNPPTTQPYGSFTFTTSSQITNGLSIDISTNNRISGITASPVQNPNAQISSTLISSRVDMNIRMTITNTIQSNDIISFTLPPEISCTYVNAASVGGNPGNSITIINSTTFQFRNTAPYNPFPINVTISNLTLPDYAASITSPFIMSILRNNYLVCKMNASFSITLSPGSLTGTLSASNYQAGVSSNYTFSLSLQHPITSSSKITFYFNPLYFNIPPNITCISSGSTNCSAISQGNIITVTSVTLVTTSSLIVTIVTLTNPSAVGNFTPVIITTYTQFSSVYYLLDSSNTFAYFAVLARPMSLSNLNMTPSTYKVYDVATYNFSIMNNNYLPANSYIWIVFPPEVAFSSINCSSICVSELYNGSNGVQFQQLGPLPAQTISNFIVRNTINPISTRPTSSFSLYVFNSQNNLLEYLSSGINFQAKTPSLLQVSISTPVLQNSYVGWFNITLSPTYQINTPVSLILNVPNSLNCPSCLSSALNSTYTQIVFNNQTMASGKYTLSLPNFTYYYSLESISLQAAIMSDNDLIYNYANGSLTIVNQLPSSPSFSYSFTNYILQASTDLIISNISSSTIPQRIASIQLIIGTDFDTTLVTCGNQGYSCTINGSVINLRVLNIGDLISFSIKNLITPLYSPSTIISLSTYSSTGYLIDQSSIIIWKAACTLPCKTCNSILTQCLSCYSDLVLSQSRVLYFAANLTCISDCGDQYYRNYSTNVCMSCSSSCFNCYNYSYCTSCPTGRYLLASNTTCFYDCPTGYFQKSIYCIACAPSLNCYTCTNELTCSSCYLNFLYQSKCISPCPSLTTVPNSNNYTCDLCPTNCTTCQLVNGTTICLSCSSGLLDNGACVQSCITFGYVPNNLICSPCDSNCKTCQGSPTFCLSCANNSAFPYFLKNKCYFTCPNRYYNDDNSYLCMPCTPPCETCYNYSTNACISCLSPSSLYEATCKTSCPTQFYINAALCSPCVAPCLTCTSLQLCYTCQVNFTLFSANYTCLEKCPDGYVSMNQTCIPCSSNCFNCLSVTFCSSCHNNSYLLNGFCYNPCPSGYYSDVASSQCTTCPNQCTFCTSPTYCTGCSNGHFMSNNSCISLCATNQISINGFCTNCNPSCITCQGNINNCTACSNGYIFAPSINSCFSSCPAYLYYDPSSNTCISSCIFPHYTLTNSTNNMTTCKSCPSLCTSCISDTQCGGCANGTYSYANTCNSSCPIAAPYAFNFKCQSCNVVSCQTCNDSNCIMCSSGLLLIGSSLCITSCSSLQVYNSINKTCDTIITNSSNSNSNSNSSISFSGLNSNTNTTLDFIPMPFFMIFIIVAIIVSLLHLNAKLSALPTLLGIIGPLISLDIISIIIICEAKSMVQSTLSSVGVYTLIATLVITIFLSIFCIRMRYRLTQCQKTVVMVLACLHHDAFALLTANINYYNSYYIQEHKYFWRKYRLLCKIGVLSCIPIFVSGVALVFSITDRSNYIFYSGIQLCILAFIQLLLTLAWIWLPVQSPPEKIESVAGSMSEQSTEQVSDGHESVMNQSSHGQHDQKVDSMEKINSSSQHKEEQVEEEIKIRNSDIKSQGDKLEKESIHSAGYVKSNYQFNQIKGVVKVNATDIQKALQKGLFRKNQEDIMKQIKQQEEYSKIDDAQKLNNYLKKQQQKQLINIFQDFADNDLQDDILNVNSPKVIPKQNQHKDQMPTPLQPRALVQLQTPKRVGSDGSMGMYDQPLLIKEEDFHHNIIFEQNQEENNTYFEGDSEINQQMVSPRPLEQVPNPSLGSIIYKNTQKVKVDSTRNNNQSRLISPEFESNRKENVVIQDVQDSFHQDNFNVFHSGNSRIRPKFSKQLSKQVSKEQASKQVIHADFEQIISISDRGSLEFIEDDYDQHNSNRRLNPKRINQNIHDHDNNFFRPSDILRQASVHYQPEMQRNQAPKKPAEKPLPRFASQLSKKK